MISSHSRLPVPPSIDIFKVPFDDSLRVPGTRFHANLGNVVTWCLFGLPSRIAHS